MKSQHAFSSRSKTFVIGAASLGVFASAARAQAPGPVFSIDYRSPTVGIAHCPTPLPITEGDLLVPCAGAPAYGPLAVPRIAMPAGGAPPSLGLALYGGCVGHPGGTPCGIEVDALSFGRDALIKQSALPAGTYVFSVDRCSLGFPSALAPNVFSEAPFADQPADVFEDLGLPPGPLPPGGPSGNSGIIDGNGLPSGSGAVYPGLGLLEPPPAVAMRDDLDALEMDSGPMPGAAGVYFSLDGLLPDPCTGMPGSGSAMAHGFRPGDVLFSPGTGAPPVLYAPAPVLGLDLIGPMRDDLDALALFENGIPGYQPSAISYDWIPAGGGVPTDMLLFSVRRASAVIGLPDSNFGIPIEPGDILTTPRAGGLSPFPAIFIAAEWLGLRTTRTHGVLVQDDLDALDTRFMVQTGLPYCFGTPAACPCGNAGAPGHGCANSVFGAGALLSASGIASVSADSVLLTGTNMPNGPCLYFQGTTQVSAVFGDGRRCVGGAIIRAAIKFNVANTSSFPVGADPAVSVAGALPPAGGTRFYQIWHRDAAAFCTPFTYNLSNGLGIVWTP